MFINYKLASKWNSYSLKEPYNSFYFSILNVLMSPRNNYNLHLWTSATITLQSTFLQMDNLHLLISQFLNHHYWIQWITSLISVMEGWQTLFTLLHLFLLIITKDILFFKVLLHGLYQCLRKKGYNKLRKHYPQKNKRNL